MTIIVPIVLLLVFLIIGVPVAFSLAAAGGIGLLMSTGLDSMLGVIESTPYRSTAKFLLSAVPMFILMAEFLSRAGLTRGIFDVIAVMTRKIAGGLGIATVIASAVMAAVTGSSTASAATMSKIAVPEMMRKGYSEQMSLGIVSVAGTLAIMIPPSIGLILYGMLAEISIGKMLIAGVIPGILTAIVLSIVIFFWYTFEQRKKGRTAGGETDAAAASEPGREYQVTLKDISRTLPIFLLIFIVIGGLYSGIVTATEAAALGALGALIVGKVFGTLNYASIVEALKKTALTTTMIFTVIIGATIFGYFMTLSQGTLMFVNFITGMEVSRWIILIIILIVFLVLGFFMDQVAILLLMIPVIIPVVSELGFDLIWFGILVIKMAEIGLVTPPVGLNVFITASAVNKSVASGFKGSAVLLIGEFIMIVLLLLFPALSLWLPGLMTR